MTKQYGICCSQCGESPRSESVATIAEATAMAQGHTQHASVYVTQWINNGYVLVKKVEPMNEYVCDVDCAHCP